jgi:hypothetical protein
MPDIPVRLQKALKARRVVPFVGAGLSRRVDASIFPSWNELLTDLASESARRNYITASESTDIQHSINNGLMPYAAELLRKKIPNEEFSYLIEARFLRDTRGYGLEDQTALIKIEPLLLVTTNFDRLLEDAYARFMGRAPSVFTHIDAVRLHNRLQKSRTSANPIFFKVHGDIDEIDNLIIGERDYKRLMFDEKAFDAILANILLNHTVLFVGYSLRDYEVTYHLERINTLLKRSANPDYIIVERRSVRQIEIQRWREEYNVEAIVYDASTPTHAELLDVLKQLEAYL